MNLAEKPIIPSSISGKPPKKKKPPIPLGYRLKRRGTQVDWGNESIRILQKCIIEEGLTYRETADKTQVSFTTIYNAARKFEIRSRHVNEKKEARKLAEHERVLLVELLGLGLSIRLCAEHLGIAHTTLQSMLQPRSDVLRDGRSKHKTRVNEVLEKYGYEPTN